MKWISVKERLPESSKNVLAYKSYGQGYMVASYFDGKWFPPDGIQFPVITHWMPLPEPPKEKE